MALVQSSAAPTRKVAFGGVAAAITTITVYVLNNFVLKSHPITGEVAGAFTTLLSFAIAYIVPPTAADDVVSEAAPQPAS